MYMEFYLFIKILYFNLSGYLNSKKHLKLKQFVNWKENIDAWATIKAVNTSEASDSTQKILLLRRKWEFNKILEPKQFRHLSGITHVSKIRESKVDCDIQHVPRYELITAGVTHQLEN